MNDTHIQAYATTIAQLTSEGSQYAHMLRALLRTAESLGMVPRFRDLVTLRERMFPFEPVEPSDRDRWLATAIIDSYVTALACADHAVALRSYVTGEHERGMHDERRKHADRSGLVPLSLLADAAAVCRERIESICLVRRS